MPKFPAHPAHNVELLKALNSNKGIKVMAAIKNIIGFGTSRKARSASLPITPFPDQEVANIDQMKSFRSSWKFGSKEAKVGLRSEDALLSPQQKIDEDLIPCKTNEQKLVAQEAYLRNLQHEEVKLYENVERHSEVQARAIYLKNLQDEEAKLFASPNSLKATPSCTEGAGEQDTEDNLGLLDCKACETYLKNLQEEEAKLFSLPTGSNSTSASIEPPEGEGGGKHNGNDGGLVVQSELHLKQEDTHAECEEDQAGGLWQQEPDLKLDLKKVEQDAKSTSKLKLHQLPSTTPLCPSPQMQKAIIASRPLLPTMPSPRASSHGDQEDSDPASLNERLQVLDNGSIQQESTSDQENRSRLQQEGENGPGKGVLNIENRSDPRQEGAIRLEDEVLTVKTRSNYRHEGANGSAEEALNMKNRSNPQQEGAIGAGEEVLIIKDRSNPEPDSATGPKEQVLNFDPRYQRGIVDRTVNTSVGTDREDRSKIWTPSKSELEVSTQTEEGLGRGTVVQENGPDDGRRQVRASFEKNLAELDAAIVHVNVQDDKMTKMCSAAMERAQGSSTGPSAILSRLAQAMGQSTGEVEEDLESDVDSDELSFHETQEEFSLVDDSEWPIFAGSDVDSQQAQGEFQRIPGDHSVERRWRCRDLAWNFQSSNDFRVLERPSMGSVGNISSSNSNFADEELRRTSMHRRRSSNEAILARLISVANCDENTQQSSRPMPLNTESYDYDEDQLRRPSTRRRSSSSSSAILARFSAVASGNSSGQLSRDASQHETAIYLDQDFKTRLVRTQSSNNEAISARLSEIARDEQLSKSITPRSSVSECSHRTPFRSESSNTAILARLAAVANGENIEQISAKSSTSYDNQENQKKSTSSGGSIGSRRGSSSSAILSRLSEVVNNEETRPSPRESGCFGNNIEDQQFAPARRRSSSGSSSSSAILGRLSTIVDREQRTSESSQQSSDILTDSSSNPRQELLRTLARPRSSSSSSDGNSATLGRFSVNTDADKSQQDSDPRVFSRRQSSVRSALLLPKPTKVPSCSREDEIQQLLRNVRVVVGNPSNADEEIVHKRPASRRSSSGEAILARLSIAFGNKQTSGDPSFEGSGGAGTNQPDRQHQDTQPLGKDETIQHLRRASTCPSSSSNYQIRETEEGSTSTNGVKTEGILESTPQQGIPNANGFGQELYAGHKSSSSFRPYEDQPSDDCQVISHIEPSLVANSEKPWLVTAQEREIMSALAQLRQDSLDRMSALEQLLVPNFDELAQRQSRARESMARIRIITSRDRESIEDKQVLVPGEYLIGQSDSGSTGLTRERIDSGQKKIEVQRTWVALMEEREIAKALGELSKENIGRGPSRSRAPP